METDTRVKKLYPGDLSNIQEYEEYFSDMSKEGLHLTKLGVWFLHFKRGQPKELNYRIDLAKDDEEKIKIELHKQKGWDFIDEKEKYLVFAAEKSSGLQELYSTPEAQRLALLEAQDSKIKNPILHGLFESISLIVLIGLILFRISTDNGLYLSLSIGIPIITYSLFTLFPFLNRKFGKGNLKRIDRILERGEFLRHEGDYFLMKSKYLIKRLLSSILLFLVGILLFTKVYRSENVNLNLIEDLNSLPMITISDIEDTDYVYDKNNIGKESNDIFHNRIYKDWNLLIPKTYHLSEELKIKKEATIYNRKHPWLNVDYYLGRFEFISKGLENDILKRENIKYNRGLEEIKKTNNISCYGKEIDNEIYLLLRKDKHVIWLRYREGTATMEEIINQSLEKLDKGI